MCCCLPSGRRTASLGALLTVRRRQRLRVMTEPRSTSSTWRPHRRPWPLRPHTADHTGLSMTRTFPVPVYDVRAATWTPNLLGVRGEPEARRSRAPPHQRRQASGAGASPPHAPVAASEALRQPGLGMPFGGDRSESGDASPSAGCTWTQTWSAPASRCARSMARRPGPLRPREQRFVDEPVTAPARDVLGGETATLHGAGVVHHAQVGVKELTGHM